MFNSKFSRSSIKILPIKYQLKVQIQYHDLYLDVDNLNHFVLFLIWFDQNDFWSMLLSFIRSSLFSLWLGRITTG